MIHSCPTPCRIQDHLLVQHSTNGAVDGLLTLKASSHGFGHVCLESKQLHLP